MAHGAVRRGAAPTRAGHAVSPTPCETQGSRARVGGRAPGSCVWLPCGFSLHQRTASRWGAGAGLGVECATPNVLLGTRVIVRCRPSGRGRSQRGASPPFSCRDRSGTPRGGRPSCTGGKTHAHHQSQGWGEPSAQQTRLNTRRPHVPVAVPGACSQTLGPGCASGSRFLREPRGPGTPRPAAAHTRDPQSRPARLRSRPSRLLAEPRQSGCRAADPRRRGSPAPSRGEPHAP